MVLVKLTPENARNYIGKNVVFTSRNTQIVKTIISVSESGKTISIDHPDLGNNLQIVTRAVYVMEE
jgi:hypothetical protein